jgi:Domain of unknown function (DUF4124)
MRSIIAIAIAATLALPAGAETLYKLIDKNGKVTYSEEKPKSFDGQVIRIDIDTNANTATLPKPPPAGGANRAKSEDPQVKRDRQEDRVRIAREKVEAARKALEDAQNNPGEGEITFIGKVGGGARPVPSEAYQARLLQLEQKLKMAEEELRVVEKES